MARTHYFPPDHVHFTWDAGHAPVITIDTATPSSSETRDVSDNQIGPDSDASVDRGPRLGPRLPARRAGRRRGRAAGRHAGGRDPRPPHEGWGWTAILPGPRSAGGRLPGRLPAHLRPHRGRRRPTSARTSRSRSTPFLGHDGRLPGGRERAAGDAARAPSAATWTRASSSPGRRCTCRCRSTGALFSCGDAHGCQGDGEICVTGLEAPMYATLRFSVEKGRSIPAPQYRTRRAR